MLRILSTIVMLTGWLLPTPARADEPARRNVLFLMADDLNCDLGCYGHPLVKSPNIDALAARGVRFERAYCQYPVCNPSRSSIMTGLYPEQTGVLNNGHNFRTLNPDVITLPQAFRRAGYWVGRVGKIYHYGVPNQIGTSGDDDAASWELTVNPRGLDREVHDRIHTLVPNQFGGTLSWLNLDSSDEEQTDGIGASAAIRLLEEQHPDKTGKPFFLAVGFYRPHTPYVAPSRYFDLYDRDAIHPVLEQPGDRDDIPPAALADRPHQRELTVEQRKEIIQGYYAAISYMDAQVGRVLAALDRLKLSDNTVVVFVSDHGYHLGAHGLWQKQDLFEGSCKVPMIIALPNPSAVKVDDAGKSTEAIVELVDVYPTLTELCGLDAPDHVRGFSLRPVLDDITHPGRDCAMTVGNARGRAPELRGKNILGRSIRTPQYRYTEWGGGEYGMELYDYESDPEEIVNLAKIDGHETLVARMKRLMNAAKEESRLQQ